MYSRFIVPIFCAAALAFACGPRPQSVVALASVPEQHQAEGPPVVSSLSVRVDESGRGGVVLAMRVTNNGDKQLEVNFPSGQTHEFVVLDSAGRERWRWGAGRMFTQSLQNELLSVGETLSYEERWTDPSLHGRFTAVARLLSSNHPMDSRVEFVLP